MNYFTRNSSYSAIQKNILIILLKIYFQGLIHRNNFLFLIIKSLIRFFKHITTVRKLKIAILIAEKLKKFKKKSQNCPKTSLKFRNG